MTDMQYIAATDTMFGQGDADVRLHTVRVSKIRKPRTCMCPCAGPDHAHEIKIGSRSIVERAIVDGEWRSAYTCLPCLDAWVNANEYGGDFSACRVGAA